MVKGYFLQSERDPVWADKIQSPGIFYGIYGLMRL